MSSSEIEQLRRKYLNGIRPDGTEYVELPPDVWRGTLERLSIYEEALELIANYDANVTDDAGREVIGRPAVHAAVRSIARDALGRLGGETKQKQCDHPHVIQEGDLLVWRCGECEQEVPWSAEVRVGIWSS